MKKKHKLVKNELEQRHFAVVIEYSALLMLAVIIRPHQF